MNDLLKTAFDAMNDKQAENLVIIDMRKQNPFIDYFIIGSASNHRKAHAIIDEVVDKAEEAGFKVKSYDTSKDAKWLIADLDTVVCHIFVEDEREKYNLEGLWKDLPTLKKL